MADDKTRLGISIAHLPDFVQGVDAHVSLSVSLSRITLLLSIKVYTKGRREKNAKGWWYCDIELKNVKCIVTY